MYSLTMSRVDTDYVRWQWLAYNDAGVPVDVSGDVVKFAFLQGDDSPTDSDWHVGEWSPTNSTYARILVGPDGLTLPVGQWTVWIRLIDNPTTPTEPIGYLIIF